MKGAQHAVLDHLTHAAQSLQAAHELAVLGGANIPAQIIQRASVFVGSSISAVVSPLEYVVSGATPTLTKPRERGIGGCL